MPNAVETSKLEWRHRGFGLLLCCTLLKRPNSSGVIPVLDFHRAARCVNVQIRNGDAAADFFKNNPDGSYIMADGYAGYNKLKDFNRCCYYAHIRRYFIEAIPKGHEKDFTNPAVQGMLYCNKLFEYERSYREKGLSYKQIYNRWQRDQKPVVEAFLSWMNNAPTTKGTRFDRAITYAKNRNDTVTLNFIKV